MTFKAATTAFAFTLTALLPVSAMAYVGPGAGISLIGAAVGLIVALATALCFVVAWPLRALFGRRRAAPAPADGSSAGGQG